MKRFLALAALVLGLAACQTEPEGLDVIVGGEVDTVVSVSLPEATRAGVDSAVGFDLTTLESSDYSLRYILEIYLGDSCQRHVLVSDATSVAFPVRLAPGRDYTFVAWADIVEEKNANGDDKTEDELKADRYYNTQDGLDNISIVDNTWNAMDESRDAFTAKEAITGFSAQAVDLQLKRPFAKLRVVATDREDVVNLGLTPHTTVVKYSQAMPTAFDASTGQPIANSAIENKSHTVTYTTDVYKYKDNEYTLFADYFFVPSTGTAKFEFNVYADAAQTNLIKGTNFNTDIFVEANKLTTIKGDVLTTGGNVSIKIENDLGVKETYTYITSAAALLKAMNSVGNFVLGHDITVSEADIAAADRLAATRTTSKKTVIDLNGKTITIDNRSTNNQPLVTLDEGNTLVFAGAGNIVMTSESTAPFVNTDTNDAIIIIEQATVTNESTNQKAVVVDGNAIVNAAAQVEADAVSGDVKPQLEYVLANGGEVTLFEDVTSDKILEISATNPVVINGNGKTISFTTNRGFRITASNNVTIENATIVNNVNGGRCIETRTGGINLTLNNVELTATNGASQPFTVGGSGNDITVNINNSTLTSGNGGYGITTFNPVALNINNSTVSGYAALNIKEASSSLGSAGSVINVTGSTLEGVNKNAGETNAFATIMLEDSNVEINVDSTSTVKAIATSNDQSALCFGNELVESVISGCEITIAGNIVMDGEDARLVGYSETQSGIGGNIVKFAAEYADELEEEGWIVGEPTDGLVTIPSAIAKVGDNLYKTLAEAVAAVEDGGTIILVENEVFTKNNRYNNGGWWDGLGYSGDKSFTIDLKNHTISQDGSLNDYLIWIKNNGTKANTITLKNGTLDAGKTAYCALATASSNAQKITINLENIEVINDITNGAVVKLRAGAELNIKDGTKIIGKNSYAGIECVASTTNIYEGAEIYQNGTSSSWGFLAGASWGGIINVYGGKGTSARGGFMAMTSGGTINVSGGEWTANVDGTIGNNSNLYVLTAQNNKYENGYKGASIINVTGGTFRGGMDAWILNDVNTEKAELNISGGNFNANPSEYVVEGYTAVEGENGAWTVTEAITTESALRAAFEQGGNIVLGADITVAETVILAEGKTAVLDLNGKKILGGLQTNTKHIYPFNIYGSLTINDSSANGSIEGRGIFVQTGSKLIVNGGSIYGIDSNGGSAIYQYGGDITINGGLIEQKAEGTYNFAINGLGGKVTVTGGKIAGNHGAIATEAAEVVLNDGEFVCTGTAGMTDNVLYSYSSGTIIINGGTFTADNDIPAGGCCVYDANGGVTINGGVFGNSSGGDVWGTTGTTIKGGKFENLIETSHIAEGYEMNANGEVVAK